jgi:negative regulator of sigma E activity
MKTTENDNGWVKQVRELLDSDLARIPPQALQRLQTARRQALDGTVRPRMPWLAVPRWVTAGGLATMAVALLTVSLWVVVPSRTGGNLDHELEKLDVQEQLELYEDLEFYRWLANGKQVE